MERTGKHVQVLSSLLTARGGQEPGEGEWGAHVPRHVPTRYLGRQFSEGHDE